MEHEYSFHSKKNRNYHAGTLTNSFKHPAYSAVETQDIISPNQIMHCKVVSYIAE